MQASSTKATSDQILVTFFITFNDGTELLQAQPLKVALQVDTNSHKFYTYDINSYFRLVLIMDTIVPMVMAVFPS